MLDLVPAGSAAELAYSGKTLIERVTGRFYTPDFLAEQLADQMLAAYLPPCGYRRIQAIDPFCGDGRLLAALLSRADRNPRLAQCLWEISLWDRDGEALDLASERIRQISSELALCTSVRAIQADSFSARIYPKFDLVITNPPWELLKPDRRETMHMSQREAEEYRERLREASDKLDRTFPDARGANSWGGWGTNLARCGWDLAMRLLNGNGILGIVLPSTLLADQSSERLRRAAFEKCHLIDIAAYPPEARLFERVDQPVVAATFSASAPRNADGRLRIFDAARVERQVLPLPPASALSSRGYAIPVGFGVTGGIVLDQLTDKPRLSEWEGTGSKSLWLGRELDETRIDEKTVSGLSRPFVKGRMINRHAIIEAPSRSVRADLATRFPSARFHRAVWRDVSRPSQKRRMIGAVIPPGWIAGNSLHIAHFRDGNLERTLALHGILSSLILEFQVRSRLATGHMSLGIVRQAHVPRLTAETTGVLAQEVKRASNGCERAAARLEVAVAKAYGLERAVMAVVLDSFEKLGGCERSRLLDPDLWTG